MQVNYFRALCQGCCKVAPVGLDRHVGDCFAHKERGLAMTRGWQVALSIDFATALRLMRSSVLGQQQAEQASWAEPFGYAPGASLPPK